MSLFKFIGDIFRKPPSRYPMDENPTPSSQDQNQEAQDYFNKLMEMSQKYAANSNSVIGKPDAFKDFGPINKYKQLPPTPVAKPMLDTNITLAELLDPKKRMQREGYEEYMKIKRSAL